MSITHYRRDKGLLVETEASKKDATHWQMSSFGSPTAQPSASRIKVIYELVQSGRYHVPASAIADKMIERLVARKQRLSP